MDRETLTIEQERETKNTVRYQKVTEFDFPTVGMIYVQNSVLEDTQPKRLTVTIRAKE